MEWSNFPQKVIELVKV